MAPIFKGQPELMAAIPSLNDPTTQPIPSITQPFPIFPRGKKSIGHNHIQAFLLPSHFLLLLSSSSRVSCLLSNGVIFKEENERDVVAVLQAKEVPLVGARVPRGSEDGSSGSDSVLGSPEPHGDVLGRPTVDPWYRSSERFPSVPASLQPPPADWEWLVMREDATADMTWTPNFQEIRDLQIQRNEMLAVPLAGVLRSILISRCSNMFRDTEALRQLVRRWCPSTHTFFFAHGELTVTLEDVENHWLLPILGDQDPAEIALSPEESKIEAVLADYIGRKNVALGTQAARFNSWMEHFLRIEDPLIRRAAFVSYWLSKCVFGEHPAYSIKPLYFCLAVKIAAGVRFPLAPLLLGQLYTQLDLLHAEELAGASCHIVSTAFNSSIVHTFIWEHALEYIRKGKKPYEIRKKVCIDAGRGRCQCWFRDVEAQDYTLIAGDVASLTYLSATNAGWLPVLSTDGPQFTIYSAHRVRRQFGFDQEVPAIMGVAAGELMAAMVEFKDSGREDISHLLESYTSPLPHPRLFGATNTMTTYANRQSLGYAVWHHEDSRGKRNVSAGTPTAVKRKQPDRSKKGEAILHRLKKTLLEGVSAPVSKKPVRKTRAGKRTFVPPTFPNAPSSIAARVVRAQSKQRADAAARIPIEIPDDLSSSSSSSDRDDPSGAAAEEIESENAEVAAAEETESEGTEAVAAEAVSRGCGSRGPVLKMMRCPWVSWELQELLLTVIPLHLPAKSMSAERVVEEHVTVGVVTGAERVVETTPITVTSSGGTVQGDISESGSHVDPSLLDSSPSTRQYVRRARRGSLVSTDSEKNCFSYSKATVQGDETAPVITEEIWLMLNQPKLLPVKNQFRQMSLLGSGVPVIEEELAQDPVDDVDMADTHDSYDEAWADAEDNMAGDQAADMEVTAPVAAQTSPTRTARSGRETVVEEEGRLQAAAVESAVRGQPGLLSAARPATSRTSVLADMDAFFREFDRTSFSSRHAEHFWTFDDVKADFEVFRVPRGGIRFLKALWEKYGSCSSYFRLGVHVGSSLLTLLCCVLAHMEYTRLEDITEVHILEWKAVVQEAIEGGFKFGFILDYLRRLSS
uniref:Aminotransferase-like plant mobile domain-containing protein n=1 Tax=Fagus sylvatica TaxID=28930 RepID=A0A2N9I2V0_FAGSY